MVKSEDAESYKLMAIVFFSIVAGPTALIGLPLLCFFYPALFASTILLISLCYYLYYLVLR